MSKSEQVTTDPKFIPEDDKLAIVGLSVSNVKTDNQLYKLVVNNNEKSELIDAQNAVAAYILWKRGAEQETIAGKVGRDVRTIKRWCVMGAAIMRTGEYTRTMGAVRLVDMSKGAMDTATQGDLTPDQKLEQLETAALALDIKSKFQSEKGKAVTDETIQAVVAELPRIVKENAEPLTAKNMADSVHVVADRFGIERKQRTPDPDGGQGPLAVESHLKAALKDARAIAKASGSAYVPTAADVKALMALCDFLEIPLMIDEATIDAVEALV